MLSDIDLRTVYDSSECNLVADLMVPLLKNSVRYDRGVGFFSSGWLSLAAEGLVAFAEKGSAARIIMSPIISTGDWEAMTRGSAAQKDLSLYQVLLKATKDLKKTMKEEPLNALAWLIADELLLIKFAIPKGRLDGGDFHDKFAIFEDEQMNKVAIHGSYNDSIHGTLNGESFSVFKSWERGQEEYVQKHDDRFKSLWNDENDLFEIYNIPQAIKDDIIRCRSQGRPYSAPLRKPEALKQVNLSFREKIDLREYQQTAIAAWRKQNCSGIFEMATGTGKTVTALACAESVYSEKGNIALIVCVPFLHLIDQWVREMQKFDFIAVACSSDQANWKSRLNLRIQDYNLGTRNKICCVATHATAATDDFQNAISQIKKNPIVGIFDEVHAER